LAKSLLPLNHERVITTALSVLRETGFEAFSMRALATALGATVGAAYRHVGGKEQVLRLAADRILAAIAFSDGGGDWRQAFADNARAYRKAFREYPGVAAYLTHHLGETSAQRLAIERSVTLLTDAGLSRADAMRTAGVLNAYLRASAGDGDSLPPTGAGRPSAGRDLRPSLALDDRTFGFGLDLLIGGIEKRLAGN